ncbi:uncharacterized protein LOC115625617 [Scaptodrosophila lebanonensis]|uniref:Uncharacterized protein LOC115625617 n=1 Tax=Drosophila lebanonensis TaxID=7225 RepID=A0A6J2TNR7_DROLE|nr:uncharacterized protein LOC115625617 [Scaptodrosophila lebanonensis]
MFILQRVCWLPHVQRYLRHYAKKSKLPVMASNKRMVHQEMLRYVNPFARINVDSEIFLQVQPADVHQYTSGDVFIAQLFGDEVKNCTATLEVDITDNDKVVNVVVKKLPGNLSRFHCALKVPIRAELYIKSGANVRVEGIQSEALEIKSFGNINTNNVKATKVVLFSENGNVICNGTLLGKSTEIKTNNGNIVLNKAQGDSLNCSTKDGGINTDCCYVENSNFQTETGRLELKNVHKCSEVHVHRAGELKMTGVHGNLKIIAKGGSMNLQLSEVVGRSQIVAQDLDNEAVINISESIEQNTKVEVNACVVNLDDSLDHVAHALSEDKSTFLLNNVNTEHAHLLINSTGDKGVRIGKQSWADILRQKIKVTD